MGPPRPAHLHPSNIPSCASLPSSGGRLCTRLLLSPQGRQPKALPLRPSKTSSSPPIQHPLSLVVCPPPHLAAPLPRLLVVVGGVDGAPLWSPAANGIMS